MKLVIVESPNKCETISRYLGEGYKVIASKGHIRDLATRGKGGLGIDVEDSFKPVYTIPDAKKKTVSELKTAAKSADEVILATDPDREGEAISWHLASVLGLDIASTKRLLFHEITDEAIKEAIANPSTIDMKMVDSQETRRIYDRVIGFKLSSLLQKRIKAKSAGRVQSVTLRMIVDNDDERKAFQPEEYWIVSIDVEIDGKTIKADLTKVDGEPVKISNAEEAASIVSRIPETIEVAKVKKGTKSVEPRLPFITSTLQQEAFNRFHFSISKTSKLAQELYEGVNSANGHIALITYIRTDSPRIAPSFYERQVKPYILNQFGEQYLGRIKSAKKGANAQDGHEAIRPTSIEMTPEKASSFLSTDQAKLYRLIYTCAIGSMMTAKKSEYTNVTLAHEGLEFSLTGSKTTFKGFEAIYGEFSDEKDNELPSFKEGMMVSVVKQDKEQKFTQPQAQFTEGKVVKMMEERGIGRPSTYSATVKTLMNRGYVTSSKGVLSPTDIGRKTTVVLKKYFPEIVQDKYTADMESRLDLIQSGDETKLEALNDFYYPFMDKFKEVEGRMYDEPEQQTGDFCPQCGAPLIVKQGKFGSFIACSNFPKCNYKAKPVKELKYTGGTCPKCGSPLVERKDKRGRTFVGCSSYPKCDYIEGNDGKIIGPKYTEADYVKPCPSCGKGHLVLKHGKKASFLGCTNYPRCKYHEWITTKKK